MKNSNITLVMIKPDAITRNLVGRISEEIQKKNLNFTEVGHAVFTLELIQVFYRWDKVNYPRVVEDYMCGKPIPVWIIQGTNALEETMEIKLRLRITLRDSDYMNIMHCSRSPECFAWEYGVLHSNGMIKHQLENISV